MVPFVAVPAGLWLCVYLGVLMGGGSARAEDFQGSTHRVDFESEPISYSEGVPRDAVSRLAKRLETNPAEAPRYERRFGYLPAVLRLLGVPVASQMLVFSKTSLQRGYIRPDNARALYFSDDLYVGFVPGAPVLEIAAVDPQLGAVFYTVEQSRDKPLRFERSADCLSCHASARSMGVPGFVLRSLETERDGDLVVGTETPAISHCTPVEDRWGGWYVTGAPPDWTHRGNKFPGSEPTVEEIFEARLDARMYMGRGSDVLPLLVHDHQVHMHNYFTRLAFEVRRMLAVYGHIRYLKNPVEALLRYMLFAEEAPLPGPLAGNPEFVGHFLKDAHRDSKGRSLRDFDLKTRLFKHRCSFLIESDSFRELPSPLRDVLLARLWEILTGQDQSEAFSKLEAASRRETLEILREVLPDLPPYWFHDEPGERPAEKPEPRHPSKPPPGEAGDPGL
jgi:hypothetical protein